MKTRHEDTLGLSEGVDKRARRPCRTPGNYPGLGEGREQQGSGSPKCCVHGHISTSPSGSTSRLSKGIGRSWDQSLGFLLGFQPQGSALISQRCPRGAGSQWERMNRDRNRESHLQVSGIREPNVSVGVCMGEVYQLMGSITEDHKSKVSPPQGTALPSCLKAEHEGKEAQGSPRGRDLGGSRGGDSMDNSNTSRGFTDCFSKANIFQYG